MSQTSIHVDPEEYKRTLACLRGEAATAGNTPNRTQRRLPNPNMIDRTDLQRAPRDPIEFVCRILSHTNAVRPQLIVILLHTIG